MAAPTYRIGPSDIFSGGDLSADADTLDGQVNQLDNQMDGNEEIPQPLFDAWNVWLATWRGFKTDHFGGFLSNTLTALNDSNRDQLIAYENGFIDFAGKMQAYGVGLAGPIVQPSTGAKDTLADQLKNQLGLSTTSIGLIVVGLVVLIIVWKA
jgi:hypothetical protein